MILQMLDLSEVVDDLVLFQSGYVQFMMNAYEMLMPSTAESVSQEMFYDMMLINGSFFWY
jgi:hypothetical protein